MVLVWLLGLVDVLCAISLLAGALGYPLYRMQAVAALALLAKGVAFYTSIVSILDIIAAIVMLYLLWSFSPTIALGIAIYLGLKGVMSFF